jgi:hypothetical protein
MVDQALADLAVAAAEPGHQHQLGVLHSVRGEHVGAGRRRVDGVTG